MDGYDRDREPIRDNNQRGRIFENGSYRYFRDKENGYVQGSKTLESPKGRMQVDKYKETRGLTRTIEEKSGRFEGPKDEKQLKVARYLLGTGEIHKHVVRSVEGEYVSKEVRELIEGLERDFPDRFEHQVISRAVARQIWAIGLQRESGQQLELRGVGDQAREQRNRQRQQQGKDPRQLERGRGDEPQKKDDRVRAQQEAARKVAREERVKFLRAVSARDIPGRETPGRAPPATPGQTRTTKDSQARGPQTRQPASPELAKAIEAATRAADEWNAQNHRSTDAPQPPARSAHDSRPVQELSPRDRVIREASETVAREARAALDKAIAERDAPAPQPPTEPPPRTASDEQAKAAREAAIKERNAAIEWAQGRLGPLQVPGATSVRPPWVPPPAIEPPARDDDETTRARQRDRRDGREGMGRARQ
ncbi:hypothetical protein [Nocardia goodfellowii]|uniref:Uncharacterized protein n=1 Tax=Nocardia goodfellowii TaxID=882446 RepID=A0ABS4QG70_9NOCA|nr:hypothetical protein [Nocardia goodfellowii]MBP2190677.1 hypothetical protein [Nocardia goodfellowii]